MRYCSKRGKLLNENCQYCSDDEEKGSAIIYQPKTHKMKKYILIGIIVIILIWAFIGVVTNMGNPYIPPPFNPP